MNAWPLTLLFGGNTGDSSFTSLESGLVLVAQEIGIEKTNQPAKKISSESG